MRWKSIPVALGCTAEVRVHVALKAAVTTRKDVGKKDLEQYNRRILWVVFHVASSVQYGFIFLLYIRLCVCSHK